MIKFVSMSSRVFTTLVAVSSIDADIVMSPFRLEPTLDKPLIRVYPISHNKGGHSMKRMAYLFGAFIIVSVLSSAWWLSDTLAQAGSGNNQVQGHMRRDGTYVQPHQRTNPNSTKM